MRDIVIWSLHFFLISLYWQFWLQWWNLRKFFLYDRSDILQLKNMFIYSLCTNIFTNVTSHIIHIHSIKYIICLFRKQNIGQFKIQVLMSVVSFKKDRKAALMIVAQAWHMDATHLLLKRNCQIKATVTASIWPHSAWMI